MTLAGSRIVLGEAMPSPAPCGSFSAMAKRRSLLTGAAVKNHVIATELRVTELRVKAVGTICASGVSATRRYGVNA
jgi:hypothetical protein